VKAVVLGGKGFVGSALVREAERREIECLAVDLDNYRECRGTECDLFINAAGNSRKYLAAREPAEDFRISLGGLISSFGDFRFSHYVYISSVDVYPDPSSPARTREEAVIDVASVSNYGLHKYLGEQMVRHYASSWLILRLGGILGPGLKKNPVYDLLHGIPLRVSEESRYQYLDAGFFSGAVFALAAAGRWGEVYNACGRGTVALREVRRMLDAPPEPAPASVPVEHYRINNDKLGEFTEIPATADTVRDFIAAREARQP